MKWPQPWPFVLLMLELEPWACDQNKGMERCGPKVQHENHIHTFKSVRECEGLNPHNPKWIPILRV